MRYIVVYDLTNIIFIDELKISKPKTKLLNQLLENLAIHSAIFLEGDKPNKNFMLASRNLKNVKYMSCKSLSALDLLSHDKLIISKNALIQLQESIN